jgi:conjugative relaxase-like TrwC/TraI family protein
MESVAAGDSGARPSVGLAAYYAASGTPPGRFLGAGLAELDGGGGVEPGSPVGEEHLRHMLGEMCDPLTGQPVGATPILSEKRVPVAGFDLTFSVPKSVSVAWALADPETKSAIYDCHRRAIDYVISYAERNVLHSRSGPQGTVEEDITGVIAAAFTHWDSRAGDPQLHDHVVVWNRARSVSDGRWRTLDSRGLFKAAVMLSELHQGVLSDLVTEALGVGWDEREQVHSEHRHYDVVGVSEALMEEFSQRAAQVEARKDQLVKRFVAAHGRQPSAVEAIQLRQQATLETRPKKAHRSLAEMTVDWRRRAEPHLGAESAQLAWVASLAGRNDLPLLHSSDFAEPILADAARSVRDAVSSRRATFSRHNVAAEALRLLHGVRFASPGERVATAERITSLALDTSLLLNPPTLAPTPEQYLRADGTSRLQPEFHKLYTTEEILQAEARLLDASHRTGGPAVSRQIVAQVADQPLAGRGERLSVDQALAVEKIATSGRFLDVLLGPAGTGKSTAMAALRAAWEESHGPGSVIGLAPSATAAEALAAELGIATENTAKWLTEWRRVPELVARRQRLAASPPSPALRQRVAELDASISARQPQPGQLLIVDEASLAGTLALDELVTAANSAGAKVLLVGDYAQLSPVEAGGAFGLLARDRGDLAPRLSEVRRFANEWEKNASLGLRAGHAEAIDAYSAHGRILEGDRDSLLDAIYRAWKTDVEVGKVSLMIAPDTATVAELNRRARADRVSVGDVAPTGVTVADRQTAGVGDLVVTRRNDRRIAAGGKWVKNGDRWVVAATHRDGGITARRTDGTGEVVLPASYVAEHVELAYATTAHQSQGRTVDTVHAFVSPATTREVLYVSITRGRESNRIYVDTRYDPDPTTGHDHVTKAQGARQVLEAVLASEGADLSAHETLRRLHMGTENNPIVARSTAARQVTSPPVGQATAAEAGRMPGL